MRTIIMPRLDMTMERGQLSEWLVKEGDMVKQGDPLAKIMSEKVTYELESPVNGALYKIIVKQGDEVPIGQVIGVIKETGDDPSSVDSAVKEAENSLAAPAVMRKEEEEIESIDRPIEKPSEERIKISPVARRLAEERGIGINEIRGTGPGGRIIREDILKAVEQKTKGLPGRIIPLVGIRKIIAERMAHSFRTAPHGFATMEVDMSKIKELRRSLQEATNAQVPYDAIFVKAVAKALQEYPILNSTLEKDQIRILDDINIGIAVAREQGLVVPVIHNADKKSMIENAKIVEELVKKARADRLSKSDVTDGTFTISNLGVFGVDTFMAIINPPQTAILGVAAMKDKPQVVDGNITVRPTLTLILTADHRVVDGDVNARFLGKIKQILENPSQLLV